MGFNKKMFDIRQKDYPPCPKCNDLDYVFVTDGQEKDGNENHKTCLNCGYDNVEQ